MSRFSESPPPRYEAPLPRGRRHAEASEGQDGRWIGRSRSGPRGNIRGRGSAYLPSRSRSRSFEGQLSPPPRETLRQGRPRHRRADPRDVPLDQVDEFDESPPPPQRGERRREERPRPSRRQLDGDGPGDEVPQERDRRGERRRPGREKDRDYSRKMMETQQAQMRSMMGMMNPAAMQMAMMQQQMQMGMVHPAYMQAMQQQQQQMMLNKRGSSKRAGAGGSSSDSDSSSSSGEGMGVPNPAAAMAAMAAMYGQPAAASAGPPPQAGDFKPPPGMPPLPPPPPPPGSRPPSFQAGGGDDENAEAKTGAPAETKQVKQSGPGARGSAKREIEKMIDEYRLSVGCAWTMRALAPDKQKLAARIDPSGQEDPSGYVAEQLKLIV